MEKRSRVESDEHMALIAMMFTHFQNLGYRNIKADLDGYDRPDFVTDYAENRYIPDLTCNKNDSYGTFIALEAETCSTINSNHTAGQWRAFANAQGEFHLAVPTMCGTESGRSKAQRRLNELRITADAIWTPK
ncbi:MAG: hypothetical protein AAF564_25450 [Bacteroidota bacterium]